jgi:predicted AlkP superfamily phosphohydrolase/phosphomutase/tetratricopeptide (TPR) repeat protein
VNQGNKKRKVLVIGWDAADWKVINPLMDAGLMPTLNSLVNKSVIGNLATLDPPLSPMLWTSIATGKRPYKHGIHGFVEKAEDGKTMRPITIRDRKCKAIWNILSENNYKTHVIGWWPSHPAENINGISISNYYQRATSPVNEPWTMWPGTVSPDEKSTMFAQMRIHPSEITINHIGAFIPSPGKIEEKDMPTIESLCKIIADNSTIHAAATYILEYEEWDFLAVYYDGIDHFNHGFMKFHPPRQEFINERDYELYKDIVAAGYRFHDMMLKRLLQLAGDECTVLLVSDHGFHPDHQRREYISRELAGPAAEHSQYGIFCMRGVGIKKDEIVYGASLLDVTPTLLTLLDLPVGEDMDGKSLTAIFEKEIIPYFIPSWEENGYKTSFPPVNTETDERVIKQLVDLGYIEDSVRNDNDAGNKAIRDNRFYLARSFIDGNKFKEAVDILEVLFSEEPYQIRFAASLCNCYQKLFMHDEVDATIDTFKTAAAKKYEEDKIKTTENKNSLPEYKIPEAVNVMEATSLMSRLKAKEALELLSSLTNKKGTGRIYLRKGLCYVMLKDFENAIIEFENELAYNYDEPEAHHGIGYCLLKQNKYGDAIEHFLNAAGLKFNYPLAHFHLGESFFHMERFEEAKSAYEVCLRMEPGMNRARQRIATILKNYYNDPVSEANILKEIAGNISETIYVVSGLPRSGTSLMMQMLSAGGMEMYIDGKRKADENNPRGYFEHEDVLRINRDTKWLHEAANKVVKIVSPLLTSLPPRFHYKIIFMERDIMDIMVSQQTMLMRNGKSGNSRISMDLLEKFKSNLNKVTDWFEKNKSHVEVLRIPFEELVSMPDVFTNPIKQFLNVKLNEEMMIKAIDKSLYRVKADR